MKSCNNSASTPRRPLVPWRRLDAGLGSFEAKLNSVAETMSVLELPGRRDGANPQGHRLQRQHGGCGDVQAANRRSSNQKGPRSPKTPGSGGGVDDKPVKPNVDPSKIKEAEDAASKFVLTWETLSRVVATQFIRPGHERDS